MVAFVPFPAKVVTWFEVVLMRRIRLLFVSATNMFPCPSSQASLGLLNSAVEAGPFVLPAEFPMPAIVDTWAFFCSNFF